MKKLTFDEALNRLEEIASLLESEEVSLEKSIEYLKEAAKLKEQCQKTIKDAKIQIEILTKDGTLELVDEETLE